MLDKFKTVCADCGYDDVTWAIINRGLLICDECCSVHRSLGRHISQLKSLNKGHWRSSQLNMVQALNNGSINSFWEHTLSDPKFTKKKLQPNDPIHPNKMEFIRAKHQELAFILRTRNSDTPDDLNQQLHSSVRTSNLETSLRLLIHGADPNYYHSEKGNYVIHVAAHAGQMEQIELLISYGADPTVIDTHGNTPASCARMNNFPEIEEKIVECTYDVTDTLCAFLCDRRPNHKTEHFILPDISQCKFTSISNKQIQQKLQQLPNSLFEELVMDIYDEVDRRENEAISESCEKLRDQTLVPFLPVNPELSTMRNQGRQKLARLNTDEFATLVLDILSDCQRRQNPYGDDNTLANSSVHDTEEDPIYDSVASDDDYATAEEIAQAKNELRMEPCSEPLSRTSKDDTIVDNSSSETDPDLKSRLVNSEVRISELVSQVIELQKKMEDMKKENLELRNTVQNRQDCFGGSSDSLSEIKPRPTSLYNIARHSSDGSNNLIDRKSQPDPEEILRKADQVTKRLQELSKTMRSMEYHGTFAPCIENVRVAVAELSAVFPKGTSDELIRSALRTLNTNTIRLQAVCADIGTTIDKVRNCAFNMAKANRQILTHYQF